MAATTLPLRRSARIAAKQAAKQPVQQPVPEPLPPSNYTADSFIADLNRLMTTFGETYDVEKRSTYLVEIFEICLKHYFFLHEDERLNKIKNIIICKCREIKTEWRMDMSSLMPKILELANALESRL